MFSLPSNWVVATGYKACCSPHLGDNIEVVLDSVGGVTKPVLALKANNMDNPAVCKPGKTCHKMVRAHLCPGADAGYCCVCACVSVSVCERESERERVRARERERA